MALAGGLVLFLCMALGALESATADPAADGADAAWTEHALQAAKALEMSAGPAALAAAHSLGALRPDHPLPAYIRARVAELDGYWVKAALHYREIFVSSELSPAPDWTRLAAARWVRVRRIMAADRVRAMAAAPDSQVQQPGLCLVLPLEALEISAGDAQAHPDLEALGVAAASWIIAGLAAAAGVQAVDMPVTFLVQQYVTGRQSLSRVPPDVRSAGEELPPPVTTTLGVTYRLASLTPHQPPPWTPDGERPARYLDHPASGEWTDHEAQALAHFQAEHHLAPSGNLDPQTRRALERAYRQSRMLPATAPRGQAWSDPIRTMGRLVGAAGVLTGTLEALGPQSIRWNVAWVSPSDGRLLSVPLEGSLPAAHFEEAWTQLVQRIVAAAPGYAPLAGGATPAVAAVPSLEGLVDYGAALLLIEEGRYADAARLFERAAARGGGDRARWYAMAWSPPPQHLARSEEELLRRAVYGAPRVAAADLRRRSLSLALGVVRFLPDGSAPAGPPSDPVMTYAPSQSWLRVSGRVEGK